MSGKMKILIITAGGTIDKIYFDDMSKYEVGEPNIKHVLKNLKVNFGYQVKSLVKKDSLHMNDTDRKLIYEYILKSNHERILITHGTDTMVETGRYLKPLKNRVIVLTGSMQPAGFINSDAVFNVGFALGALQVLKKGVYIAMSGSIYDPSEAVKNRDKGVFEKKK